jgi:hypothetical protein
MVSSGMLCRVAHVRTEVSEELSASIIRVTKIGELGMLAITSNRHMLVTANVLSSPILLTPDDGGPKFLQNFGSYMSHMA